MNGDAGNDTFNLSVRITGTANGGDDDDLFLLEDTPNAPSGSWTMDGGDGNDTLRLNLSTTDLTSSSAVNIEVFDAAELNITMNADFLDGFTSVQNIANITHSSAGGTTDLTGKLAADDSGSFSGGVNGSTFTIGAGVTADWTINGANGDDVLTGGDGDDTLNGARGDDVLNGGNGNDVFWHSTSGGTTVVMNGEDGSDTFNLSVRTTGTANGGADDDLFLLEDTTAAPSGNWTIDGGSGFDTFRLALNTSDLTGSSAINVEVFDASDITFEINGGFLEGFSSVLNVSRIEHSDTGGTTDLTGKLAADDAGTMTGGSGDDTLIVGAGVSADWEINGGGFGTDLLTGGDGNDTLFAGRGTSTLNGGNGDDDLSYNTSGGAVVTMNGDAGNDTFALSVRGTGTANGGADDDLFTFFDGVGAPEGIWTVDGGMGNDTFRLESSANFVARLTSSTATNVEIFDADNRNFEINGGFLEGFSSVLNVSRIEHSDTGGTTDLTGKLAADDAGTMTGGSGDDTLIVGAGVSADWEINGDNGERHH